MKTISIKSTERRKNKAVDAHISLSPDTRCQTSTKFKILKKVQDNPTLLRGTNLTRLSKSLDINGVSSSCIRQHLNQMVNNQMLHRYGGKRRANFCINYLHKDIPPGIVDSAPESIRLEIKRTLDGVKQGQYLDEQGCIVTPAPEAPKNDENQDTPVEEVEAKPAETNEVKVPVKVEKDGNSLNITININLKLS